jgi:hypothetical protein
MAVSPEGTIYLPVMAWPGGELYLVQGYAIIISPSIIIGVITA